MSELILEKETYAIRGAVFEVYQEMGSGFLEAVYQECMEKEFFSRKIPFVSQPDLILNYKGQQLQKIYKPDIIAFGKIIIEFKTTRTIEQIHKAQILNYLKATELKLGLLINFGSHPKVQIERFVL